MTANGLRIILMLSSSLLLMRPDFAKSQPSIDIRAGISKNSFFSLTDENTETETSSDFGSFIALSYRHALSERIRARYGLELRRFSAGITMARNEGRNSFESNLAFEIDYLLSRFGAEQVFVSKERLKISGVFSMLLGYQLSNRTSGNGWSFVPLVASGPNGEEYTYWVAKEWEKHRENYKNISSFLVGAEAGVLFEYSVNPRLSLLLEALFGVSFTPFLKQPYPYLNSNSITSGLGVSYKFN